MLTFDVACSLQVIDELNNDIKALSVVLLAEQAKFAEARATNISHRIEHMKLQQAIDRLHEEIADMRYELEQANIKLPPLHSDSTTLTGAPVAVSQPVGMTQGTCED